MGGFTQADAARYFGVDARAYAQWEDGAEPVDSGTLIEMARTFGCSTDYLLGLTSSPAPPWGGPCPCLHDARLRNIIGQYESVNEVTKRKIADTVELMAAGVRARIEKSSPNLLLIKPRWID